MATAKGAKVYDLWEDKDVDNSKAQNKRKKGRSNYVPSLLNAVEVPDEGTSYNPSLESYVKYAGKVAKEEAKSVALERREILFFTNSDGEKSSIPAFKECMDVFGEALEPTVKEEDEIKEEMEDFVCNEEDITDDCKEIAKVQVKKPKPKTMKQKKKATLRRMEARKLTLGAKKKQLDQQLYSLKSIKKNVEDSLKEHEKEVLTRAKMREVDRLIGKKKLGRGKFEKPLEPIALTSELTGSLRAVKMPESVFRDRITSLQQRNILPIAGSHKSRYLKPKLKAKYVEKRSAKNITKGTRVI
ncbi:nop53 (60S ribosomal biogenesis) domain-containing protein [Ditylenchus destructor]|nr:nop53 (60S ribosomal biogenesis) domain-containing protein [Ditylenchus destructor]